MGCGRVGSIGITILRLESESNITNATRGPRNYPHRILKLAELTTS